MLFNLKVWAKGQHQGCQMKPQVLHSSHAPYNSNVFVYFTPLVKTPGQNPTFWHAGRIEKSAARLFVFSALLVNQLGPDLVTADWGQFCRFSSLKCGPKLVRMFNTFIGTKFDIFKDFENFDLQTLVLTNKGVIYAPCSRSRGQTIKSQPAFVVAAPA